MRCCKRSTEFAVFSPTSATARAALKQQSGFRAVGGRAVRSGPAVPRSKPESRFDYRYQPTERSKLATKAPVPGEPPPPAGKYTAPDSAPGLRFVPVPRSWRPPSPSPGCFPMWCCLRCDGWPTGTPPLGKLRKRWLGSPSSRRLIIHLRRGMENRGVFGVTAMICCSIRRRETTLSTVSSSLTA